MSGRFCKTCSNLVHLGSKSFRCGFTTPAPWFVKKYSPNFVIGARHVIPGDRYSEALGSTLDWTEEMDCPTHTPKNETKGN